MNKIKWSIVVVLLVVSGFSVYQRIKGVSEMNDLVQEQKKLTNELKETKEDFNAYKSQMEEQAFSEASSSDDEIIKSVGVHNGAYLIMNELSNEFFTGYFTWENGDEYRQRKELLKPITNEKIINDESLFDDGKDNMGGDYIDNTGLKSSIIDVKAFPENDDNAIVKVNYRSWFGDEESDAGEATKYYYLTFDRANYKVESMKIVFSSDE